jgi:hypothetical protein
MRTIVVSSLLWVRRIYAYILHRNAWRAHPWIQTENNQVLVPGLQLFIGEERSWLQLAKKSPKVSLHAIRTHTIFDLSRVLGEGCYVSVERRNVIGRKQYTWSVIALYIYSRAVSQSIVIKRESMGTIEAIAPPPPHGRVWGLSADFCGLIFRALNSIAP